MTPDQRMSEALGEFEALVNSGVEPDEAVAKCAAEFQFAPEAMRRRAIATFGALDELQERNLHRAAKDSRERLAVTAIDAFLASEPDGEFSVWFTHRVGRAPTKEELDDFTVRYMSRELSRCLIPKEGMYD